MIFDLLPLLVVYLLIGLIATALTGGPDPLSFGPRSMVVLWPLLVVVVVVGVLLFPSDPPEGSA